MNKNLYTRTNLLCVSQPVYAGNLPVFSCPTDGSKGEVLVPIGTPVFWDPVTGTSLAQNQLCTVNRFKAGVSVDRNHDGIPDDIALVYNDVIDPCGIRAATADIPQCGLPPVVDALFDCLEYDKTYSMIVYWRDNRTELTTTQGDWDSVQIKFKVPSDPCTACPPGLNCKGAQCEIIDVASGRKTKQFRDRLLGRRLSVKDIPVDILGLESNFYQWNLASTLGSSCCTNCVKIDLLESFTYTPLVGPAVTVPFTNNAGAGDPNFTYLPQLDGIVRQINAALGTTAASIVHGRDCCDNVLEIISCLPIVLNGLGGVPIPPTATGNPLNPITYPNSCGPCYTNGSSWTPTCGIRIKGKASHPTIGCKSPKAQLAYDAIDIKVEFVDGWENARTAVRPVQTARSPKNTGYDMFYYDYYHNHAGGHGRPMTEYNEWSGMPFPELTGRIDGVCDKCKSGYCIIHIVRGNAMDTTMGGAQIQNTLQMPLGVDAWAIAADNLVAMQSIQDYLNTILACQGCPVKTPVTCIAAGVLVNDSSVSGVLTK